MTYHDIQCPTSKPVVCANNFPAVEVTDEDGCCPHYECQCKSHNLKCCIEYSTRNNVLFFVFYFYLYIQFNLGYCFIDQFNWNSILKILCMCHMKVSAMVGETPIMSPSMERTMIFKATAPTG